MRLFKSFLPLGRSRARKSLSLVIALGVACWGYSLLAQEPVTVLQGGTLIDGNGGPPLDNVTVIIQGNRIGTLAANRPVEIPPGAKVIDTRGKYILPGLWDTHTHYHEWFPELLLTNGVTSVLIYGGGPWLNAQREGVNKKKIYGPRMFLSQATVGMIYMMEDRAMLEANILKGREDAIRRVRELAQAGSNIIKVYTSVTPELLQAITQEAHRLRLRVSGHIGFGARAAALAGIDNLAHATGLPIPDLLQPEDLDKLADWPVVDTGRLRVNFPQIARPWDRSTQLWGPNPDLTEYPLFIEDPRRLMAFGLMDPLRAKDLIQLLVQRNVFIESCIGYIFRNVHNHVQQWAEEDRLLLNDPNLRYIPERYRMNMLDYSLLDKLTPPELELIQKGYTNFQWFIRSFLEAGGKVTTGMDTSSSYHATMLPGLAVRREMQLLVEAGIPPMKTIQAATKWAAELLGQDKDLGTLEAGKLADLIVLRRNPLEDITALQEIELVMRDGEVMKTGYHYYFSNPISEPIEYQLSFPDWTVSEIPTRLTSLSPAVMEEGSDTFTLTVRGSELVSTSVVQLGATPLETRFISPSELQAIVPENLVKQVGTYPVRVVHRGPGWGKTNALFFIVKFR
ncbi:MAG: amidohydrolase family protein [Acidobacteria bacterium]|nr:amidohydrolase family protein [Acidobacteriota bacterium]